MDGSCEGGITNAGTPWGLFPYALDTLSYALTPEIKNILIIGLGAGMNATISSKRGVKVDVVEIDPEVVNIYKKYFSSYGDAKNIRIFTSDGRIFIKQGKSKYDAILMDVFLGDSWPWHLLTREAFGELKKRLTDKGVLVLNFIADPQDADSKTIVSAIHKTLLEVFPQVSLFNSHGTINGDIQNIYFAASPNKALFILPTHLSFPQHFLGDLQKILADRVDTPEDPAFLLTDDYNPIEFYTAKTQEIKRKLNLQTAAKNIYLY